MKFISYEQYKKGFSKRLRVACASKGITLKKLSRETGLSPTTVYSYANEKVLPNAHNLSKMAIVLEIDANDLLGI